MVAEKTRLVAFRRPPWGGGGPRPGTFDFLGFTHYWGRARRGFPAVLRKTARDRFTRSLRAVAEWCRRHRHLPLDAQQRELQRKLRGHYAYFGITGNYEALDRFYSQTRRVWRKWLNRRSNRVLVTWQRFLRLEERYPLPLPRVVHTVYRLAANP